MWEDGGSAIDTTRRATLTELLAAGQVREQAGKLRSASLWPALVAAQPDPASGAPGPVG